MTFAARICKPAVNTYDHKEFVHLCQDSCDVCYLRHLSVVVDDILDNINAKAAGRARESNSIDRWKILGLAFRNDSIAKGLPDGYGS